MDSVTEVQELERAGLDTVWVAEAWGFDAPSLMGFLAAETERVEIASGILPIFTRKGAQVEEAAFRSTQPSSRVVRHTNSRAVWPDPGPCVDGVVDRRERLGGILNY